MVSTIPTPTHMKMQGNLAKNWDSFKQMWSNYEISPGLIEKLAELRKATLKVVMGQECF